MRNGREADARRAIANYRTVESATVDGGDEDADETVLLGTVLHISTGIAAKKIVYHRSAGMTSSGQEKKQK